MKLFNKYEVSGIKINDPGLQKYINIKPLLVPKTTGRYASTKFWRTKYNVVERLMNKLMVTGHRGKKHKITSGHNTGKSIMVYNIVLKTFQIIEDKTKKNPVEVFVKAVENAAPREEITTIEYGGAKYPQAVEVAPQRRIDIALRYMVNGSYQRCFNKKIKIEQALANEIMKAYEISKDSVAISKKLELERQADSSR
tara:strand:- start:1238 stop:1828 length:591 start_codon:yes stop_codon:yes gene_type:complete